MKNGRWRARRDRPQAHLATLRRVRAVLVLLGLAAVACGGGGSASSSTTTSTGASATTVSTTTTGPTTTASTAPAPPTTDPTTNTPSPTTEPCGEVLHSGCQSRDVGVLQYTLVAKGFGRPTIDRSFGPGTEAALRSFEARCGRCVVDGRIVVNGTEWLVLQSLPNVAVPERSP
jgi:peptidoglycan hydrolase-like protein with peptidoglycan-binding domain